MTPDSARAAGFGTAAVETAGTGSARLTGRLTWNEDVTVRVFSPFAGRVLRVVADAGRTVRAGDTLAVIASPDFGQAQADARRAATDLSLADRTLARTRDLFAHGVVAEKDVQAAEADDARARAEAQRSAARLALYGGDSAAVDQSLVLRAPLGGVVVERNITPGQEVRPDQMLANAPQLFAPLFVVTDPSRLWVQLDLPESELADVRNGAALALRAQPWPNRTFRGTVTLVGSAVDPTSRTIKVRGVVDNPGRDLKAEMLVTVDVAQSARSGVRVPASAVMLKDDAHIVYVVERPGRFRRTTVSVDGGEGSTVFVVNGLRAGDVVVTDGSLLLEQLYQSLSGS